MPGLYALLSWEALPLKSSTVKACANGYSLSITAHLLYTNPHKEPVEGKGGLSGVAGAAGPPENPVLESILPPAHLCPDPQTLLSLGRKDRGQQRWGHCHALWAGGE